MKSVKERLARIETIQYFILAGYIGQLGINYIPLFLAIGL